eukprot:TRINITY_DN3154_c0_g1_i1.p1 TRINITY_DN3154_c0_g1~~TRINITY_DN3154_c0_g1_i1.p1  ORF type:complete len:68 (+),score=16.87 TRINITY_DN3154_c0_g1_i1:73-276(+)
MKHLNENGVLTLAKTNVLDYEPLWTLKKLESELCIGHRTLYFLSFWIPMYSALILAARLRLPRHNRG